jgi:hypothetical protein
MFKINLDRAVVKATVEIFRKYQIWTGFEPEKILIFDSGFDHSAIE